MPGAFDTFRLMAQSVAGEIGHDFLSKVVAALSDHLEATFVAITYGIGTPPTQAHTLYALKSGQVTDDITYALQGTPCQRVYDGETVVIPCGVAALYPREKAFESYIGVPLHDSSGAVTGHLAVFGEREISTAPGAALAITQIFAQRAQAELQRLAYEAERETLIEQLSNLNARLQNGYQTIRKENAQKTRLIGIIAHDLRNPLAAIISQAELGQTLAERSMRTTLDADPNTMTRLNTILDKVTDNAQRMSDLVTATLDRVRRDQINLPLNLNQVDLSALISIAAAANEPEATRKSIRICLPETPAPSLLADDSLLVSAIDNLLSNAIKYTNPGGTVTLHFHSDAVQVELSVSDTGQGLSKADLERVFGRFQTLSAKPTGGETATGLGLNNVREIAEAHGGQVSAHSAGPGKGSRFTLMLPIFGPSGANQA
mgnify:CR=1 FL=1